MRTRGRSGSRFLIFLAVMHGHCPPKARAGTHGAAGACRRGGEDADAGTEGVEAAPRLSNPGGGSCRVSIMVDYNQALTLAEALKRGRALDTHDILWIEEPITHEDYTSCARLTRALTTPVQIGENYNGPAGLSRALAAGACDLVMPDIARVGGVTGWMQASGIAAAAGIELSSHLMPELSAQLFCATATAHWLEYVDWADAFLKEPMRVVDGKAIPSGTRCCVRASASTRQMQRSMQQLPAWGWRAPTPIRSLIMCGGERWRSRLKPLSSSPAREFDLQ